MSYAIVARRTGSRGSLGAATAAGVECTGHLYSTADTCCTSDTWDNATYLDVKGAQSFQFRNELRVAYACDLVTPDGLDDLAYETGCASGCYDARLKQGLATAAKNFRDLFPAERWVKVPGAAETDCGNFAVWSDAGVPDRARWKAAVTRVLGAGYTVAQYNALVGTATTVLITVPGSAGTQAPATMPTLGELLVVQNGKIVPTAWLTSFLDAFAPGWKTAAATKLSFLSSVSSKMVVKQNQQARVNRALQRVQQRVGTEDEPESESSAVYWVAGGLALAAAAGGLWWWQSRRRGV